MSSYESYQEKVKEANINARSLLATDYLNHFNEVHMLFDMLPSMPDCMEDIQAWVPKSYAEHFAQSVFAQKELAIEAYEHSPDEYRLPFEQTVDEMNEMVIQTILKLAPPLAENNSEKLQNIINDYSPKMIALIEKCGSIINGNIDLVHQDSGEDDFEEAQDMIDDLFG